MWVTVLKDFKPAEQHPDDNLGEDVEERCSPASVATLSELSSSVAWFVSSTLVGRLVGDT